MANKFLCSDGTYVTQDQIRHKYAKSRSKKYAGITSIRMCEACEVEPSVDNDHTIAQARCKFIGKTELIWHPDNYPRSCRKCHHEWENFKSGEWVHHKNVVQRLEFLKEHDPEGYQIRIEFTKASLESQI